MLESCAFAKHHESKSILIERAVKQKLVDKKQFISQIRADSTDSRRNDMSEIELSVGVKADKAAIHSLRSDLAGIMGVKIEEPRRAIPEALALISICFTIISGTNALIEIIRKLSDFAKKGNQVTIYVRNHPIIVGYAKLEEIRDVIIQYNKENTSSNEERRVKLDPQQKANCVMFFGGERGNKLVEAIESGEIPYGNISREFIRAHIERSREIEQMDFETTRVET
jgi:hypothetical protein